MKKEKTKKLYRVFLTGHNNIYDGSYVVAHDPTEAYDKVRSEMDLKDYGFVTKRQMEKIELLAEDWEHTPLDNRLFL